MQVIVMVICFLYLVLQHGVYFEITYSRLIMDAQVRRQMISNAKVMTHFILMWIFCRD